MLLVVASVAFRHLAVAMAVAAGFVLFRQSVVSFSSIAFIELAIVADLRYRYFAFMAFAIVAIATASVEHDFVLVNPALFPCETEDCVTEDSGVAIVVVAYSPTVVVDHSTEVTAV